MGSPVGAQLEKLIYQLFGGAEGCPASEMGGGGIVPRAIFTRYVGLKALAWGENLASSHSAGSTMVVSVMSPSLRSMWTESFFR